MTAWRAERLGNGPIISPELDPSLGTNINGPSLVRIPDWAGESLGRYYLYFAHHNGTHIRLAYADAITGPWHVHVPGALRHQESLFPAELESPVPGRLPTGIVVPRPHIASPDVHVDDAERRFRMYYHGILENRWQVTRLATSQDGIHFEAHEPILGRPYWRAFEHRGWHYALAMPGIFYRSRSPFGPFAQGPTLFSPNMRHAAVLVEGDTLTVFFSNAGEDPPERILVTEIDLSPDWREWRTGEVRTLLAPERGYEGADLPLKPSIRGEARGRVHELRDPAVYREGDDLYLLYTVAGESGVALARLHRSP